MTSGKTGWTEINFNKGEMLLYAASTYPRLYEVVLELVQNALDRDVRATHVSIGINYKTRNLFVRDNGAGSSVARFDQALATVSDPNRKGKGALGRFGIGLISPLGKCKSFRFTSCPAPHKTMFMEWLLETDRVRAQRENVMIPKEARPNITLDKTARGRGVSIVTWRTEAALLDFTTDSYISKIVMEDLIGGIQDRYSDVMKRNKATISVSIVREDGTKEERPNVVAAEFRGKKLEEQEIKTEHGKTLFRLFISPKTTRGRVGRVLMGVTGDFFRFQFQYFARSAVKLLGEEPVAALASGLFEGEIVSNCVSLHPKRDTFQSGDGFIELCVAIEAWFEKFGKAHLAEAKVTRQEERFQQLGIRSMKVVEELLDDPKHASLLEAIKSFTRGSTGHGHVDIAGQTLGEQDDKTLSVTDGQPGVPREKDGNQPRPRETPETPKTDHTPLIVAGPKGERRKVVRGHSKGLGFVYEPMECCPDLWKLDVRFGLLRFNIRHPLWVVCSDKSDLVLMRLQEIVAIQALTLQVMPDPLRVAQRQVMDELNTSLVTWLIRGDRARGSLVVNKKK